MAVHMNIYSLVVPGTVYRFSCSDYLLIIIRQLFVDARAQSGTPRISKRTADLNRGCTSGYFTFNPFNNKHKKSTRNALEIQFNRFKNTVFTAV